MLINFPVALARGYHCEIAQALIRNTKKMTFQASFIWISRTVQLNLHVISWTFQFNSAFPIEISVAIISLPEQRSYRAIVLPPSLASALVLAGHKYLKFLLKCLKPHYFLTVSLI